MADNIITIEDISPLHNVGQRLLGLDLGSKTIGVALSDTLLTIASAAFTLKKKKFKLDAEQLIEFCNQQDVAAFVVGLPLNMDGSEGPRVQATKAFVRNMANVTNIPFVFWDERLSTVAAERAMLEADMSRKKRAEKIDAAAAGFILQGALDRINAMKKS